MEGELRLADPGAAEVDEQRADAVLGVGRPVADHAKVNLGAAGVAVVPWHPRGGALKALLVGIGAGSPVELRRRRGGGGGGRSQRRECDECGGESEAGETPVPQVLRAASCGHLGVLSWTGLGAED